MAKGCGVAVDACCAWLGALAGGTGAVATGDVAGAATASGFAAGVLFGGEAGVIGA